MAEKEPPIWRFVLCMQVQNWGKEMFENFGHQIFKNIIEHDWWKLYLKGAGVTIVMALIAVFIGICLGSIVAIVKVKVRKNRILRPFEFLCDVYITIIRGTPVVLQVLVCFLIIFATAPVKYNIVIAGLAFGINSGAYVSEIIRAGILAVDIGQTEAGRSLGLTENQTMSRIVFPQAIKNILPALGNEFIVLVKETAVAGYMAVEDLTKVAVLIQSRTYSAMVPLLTSALIYLCMVLLMTWGLRKFERRLARNE